MYKLSKINLDNSWFKCWDKLDLRFQLSGVISLIVSQYFNVQNKTRPNQQSINIWETKLGINKDEVPTYYFKFIFDEYL